MRYRSRPLRLGYRHNVVVPVSTNNAIIFPVDRSEGKFDLSSYDPAMTRGMVSSEEVASFLQELEPMIKPIFNSPVLSFLSWYQKLHPFAMIALFFVWIIVIVLGARSGSLKVFVILPAVFVAFMAWIGIVLIINCNAVSNVKNLIAESKSKIQSYVQARNQSMRGKGYFWVAPTQFPYWIELWVEGAPMMAVSMEQQYGIPIREEVPYYYPSNQPSHFNYPSNQHSPAMYSP